MRFYLGLYLIFALNVFFEEVDELDSDKYLKFLSFELEFKLIHKLESA